MRTGRGTDVVRSKGQRSKTKGQRGRTLNGDVEVPLVFSRRVGDHAGVLALVGQQGALYVEDMSALLKTSVDGSSQQLRTEETTVDLELSNNQV